MNSCIIWADRRSREHKAVLSAEAADSWAWTLAAYINHLQVRTKWGSPGAQELDCLFLLGSGVHFYNCPNMQRSPILEITGPKRSLGGCQWPITTKLNVECFVDRHVILWQKGYNFNQFLKMIPENSKAEIIQGIDVVSDSSQGTFCFIKSGVRTRSLFFWLFIDFQVILMLTQS